MEGPLPRYRKLVREGELNGDPLQQMMLEKLQLLWVRLGIKPEKPSPKKRGFFGLRKKKKKKGQDPEQDLPEQGLYVWGGVGRGKTMAMNLFFEDAPVEPKRKVHFHAFMQEVHAKLRAERSKNTANPLPVVAKQIADSARLLCFDEVQVGDMADAMIVGRLFEGLFAEGVIIVATSNRPPDDLYKNGINRAVFGEETGPRDLMVGGRAVKLAQANDHAMRASFDRLCKEALGPADYLKIAESFDTVMIEDVPIMTRDQRDQAKRFVTLIDALYEAKVRVLISAEAEPEALYPAGDGAFEFARTVSRLSEMRSRKYLAESKAELVY